MPSRIPDPALVVLVGASGSGKSTWAAQHYRSAEVVSSDELRGIVGSGRHDLDASVDAFDLLDRIVAARIRRGLTTVIDTLGLDRTRRLGYLALARNAGLPAVAVVFDVPAGTVRTRNGERERPVPAPALAQQLRTAAQVAADLPGEGWDVVVSVATPVEAAPVAREPQRSEADGDFRFALQLSRFPWGDDPAGWLAGMLDAAASAGFDGVALMDHLIQIPQVDRAWAPIPEPWVTLGLLAGLQAASAATVASVARLRLGTLVSPVTFRAPGLLAKSAATLSALTGGRAFVGVGAGWWAREHAGFGLDFPPPAARLRALEDAIATMRALWAPGTKPYRGRDVDLPETTCYPRPTGSLAVLVGGSGEQTLRVAARAGDGCNVRADPAAVERAQAIVRAECERAGRDPAEVALTVLDLPVTGRDRDEVWSRVEALRGRTAAAAYARTHHAGTYAQQRERYAELFDRGVRTVFVAPPHAATPEDVAALAPMLR